MKYYSIIAAALLSLVSAGLFAQEGAALYESSDEAALIAAIENLGETPEDIFTGNMACKRLATLGTDASVPALSALLSNEAQNFNARFALEAMTTDASAQALIDAAGTLTGACQAGVINSIGIRHLAGAVDTLKDVLAKTKDPQVTNAARTALSKIGTPEAIAVLREEFAKPLSSDLKVNKVLADSILRVAEQFEAAGDKAQALELYDALVAMEGMPVFVQKAAAYHGLLNLAGDAGDRIKQKMLSPKNCCFTGGLKTLREFNEEDEAAIFAAVDSVFQELPPERQALVVLALRDVKSQALKDAHLQDMFTLLQSGAPCVQLAVVRALDQIGANSPAATVAQIEENDLFLAGDAEYLAAAVKTISNLPGDEIDASLAQIDIPEDFASLSDAQAASLTAKLKIVENRRIASCAQTLVAIAGGKNVPNNVLDAALSALAVVVSVDDLELLVDAVKTLSDDKAVWLLNTACTRLPREAVAEKVGELFKAAPEAEKGQFLVILRQTGGPVALALVEAACYDSVTADKATELLGTWNTPTDLDALAAACLKLAKESPQNKYRVRGIRSYIRIPRQFSIGTDKRLAMCKTAFDTAVRQEDKLLIFEVFKREIVAKSAVAAMEYAGEEFCREAACEAAVTVGEKIQGTSDELKSAMTKVVETTQSDEIKARAEKVLAR